MIELLQPNAADAAAGSTATTKPLLHAANYTLPELHALLGVNSLKPLLAFRPTLIDALGEDAFFARGRTFSAASSAAAQNRPKVRVAFGRTIVSNLDRAAAARASASSGAALTSVKHVTNGGDEEEYEEEDDADRFDGGAQPLPLSKEQMARDAPFPWEQRAKEERAAAARRAAANKDKSKQEGDVSDGDEEDESFGVTRKAVPYRDQGDPSLSSADAVAARAVLERHPLVRKSLSKFWTLLPKEPASKGAAAGELSRDAYSTFFLRVCKLLNPDLQFDEAFALVQKDWDRDVARTKDMRRRERAEALAASGDTQRGGSASSVASRTAKRQAAASEAGEMQSIPHAAFAASLFELVDLWSAESSPVAYADLLEQLFCKLTVKVLSSGRGADLPVRRPPSPVEDGTAIPTFALLRRALHVYTEAQRVEEFATLCASAQQLAAGLGRGAGSRRGHTRSPSTAALASSSSSQLLDSLGALMNASHVSCARQYDCSCEELDDLVNVCVQHAGAVGARLTGAGWGGCVVALFDGASFVPSGTPLHSPAATASRSASIRRICDIVVSEYYRRRCRMSEDEISSRRADLLFVTEPAAGAAIYLPMQQ